MEEKNKANRRRRERALKMRTEVCETASKDSDDSCEEKIPLVRSKPPRPRRKNREPLFEEEVVDGFAILAFKTYDDLERCVRSAEKLGSRTLDPCPDRVKEIPKKKPYINNKAGGSHSSSEQGYICDSESDDGKTVSDGESDFFTATSRGSVESCLGSVDSTTGSTRTGGLVLRGTTESPHLVKPNSVGPIHQNSYSNGPIDTSNHISGVHQGLPQIPSSVNSGKVIATPHQSPISTSQTPSRPVFNECKPGAIEEKPPPYLEQKPPPYLDQKPPPYLDQKPPHSFTDQKPPISFTDQKLPHSYTDQKPPPGLIDQKPPIFEKQGVTPLSSGPPALSGSAINSQYLHTPTTTSSVTFTTATSTTTTSAPLVTHHNHVGITSSTNSISNNNNNGMPQAAPLVNGPLNSQPPLHRPTSSSGALGKYSVVSLVSSCAPGTNSSSSNSNIYNSSIISSGSNSNINNLTLVTSASCGSVVTAQSTISVANSDLQSSAAPIHHPLHHPSSTVPVHHRASTPTRHGPVLPPPPCTSSPSIAGNTSAIDPVVSVKLEPGEPPVPVSHAHTLAHAKPPSSYNTTLTSGVPYSHHPNISYPPRTSPATIGCIPSSAPTHSPSAHSITAPPHSGTPSHHSRLQNIKIEPDTHLKSVPSSAPRTSTPSHPGLPTSVRHSPARHSPRTQDPHPSLYR